MHRPTRPSVSTIVTDQTSIEKKRLIKTVTSHLPPSFLHLRYYRLRLHRREAEQRDRLERLPRATSERRDRHTTGSAHHNLTPSWLAYFPAARRYPRAELNSTSASSANSRLPELHRRYTRPPTAKRPGVRSASTARAGLAAAICSRAKAAKLSASSLPGVFAPSLLFEQRSFVAAVSDSSDEVAGSMAS